MLSTRSSVSESAGAAVRQLADPEEGTSAFGASELRGFDCSQLGAPAVCELEAPTDSFAFHPKSKIKYSNNNTANGALRDVGLMHSLHTGVLYFQNVIGFHGRRVYVVSFTPLNNVWLSLRRFSRNSQSVNSITVTSPVQNVVQNKCRKCG